MAVLIFVTDRQPGSLITRRDPTLDIADAASAKGPWITPGADPISRGDHRLRGASERPGRGAGEPFLLTADMSCDAVADDDRRVVEKHGVVSDNPTIATWLSALDRNFDHVFVSGQAAVW
jgi:hypothetical protein